MNVYTITMQFRVKAKDMDEARDQAEKLRFNADTVVPMWQEPMHPEIHHYTTIPEEEVNA